jgi:hypothetical protein
MAILDRQRPPGRFHKRRGYRYMVRGYNFRPHAVWGNNVPDGPDRAKAAPYTAYPSDSNITASDAPNAALLAGEGFVATPTTNWTTGQFISVGGFNFNWTGAAWAAGVHA